MNLNPHQKFSNEVQQRLIGNSMDSALKNSAQSFVLNSTLPKYSYNFEWLGRPIIQYPQDIIAMQEIIWGVKPDLIIETGIAHGGSLIFSASMLALLEMCEEEAKGKSRPATKPARKVLAVDIDIRSHNRDAIEAHPLSSRITMLQGSSIERRWSKK